jgi:hypothetical protein
LEGVYLDIHRRVLRKVIWIDVHLIKSSAVKRAYPMSVVVSQHEHA